MKICQKCGAVHRDNKVFCADCGEKLPKPLSKEEEAKIEWKNYKMEDFFKYENYESLTPSYWWGVSRKFAVWALLIIGTAISVFMLIGE
ncbi:MAG: zinc-ribbon domain-containing protein [Ruminococcaceae bacterium]|nr:zinc-ribbon domain-containing protein [Oscillospiraceae bacterium]